MVRKRKRPDFLNEKLGFGRFRNTTWKAIPNDYLFWLAANTDDWLIKKLARMERKRREKKLRWNPAEGERSPPNRNVKKPSRAI